MSYHNSFNYALADLASMDGVTSDMISAVANELSTRKPLTTFPFLYSNGFAHPWLPLIIQGSVTVASLGLIPTWAKPDAVKELRKGALKARSESMYTKPMFKGTKRGLLPVSGFFEWQHVADDKLPHLITTGEPIFTLGCVWTDWLDPATQTSIRTFAILTSEPNALMAYVHNNNPRMSVIIPPHHRAAWLSESTPQREIDMMLKPYPDGVLMATPVSTKAGDNPTAPTGPSFTR